MKRALLLILLLLPASLYAAPSTNRDVLLTRDGTLYSIDSAFNENQTRGNSSLSYLTLSIQDGDHTTTIPVPATLTGGNNWHPKLAFDSESKTLFVLWLRAGNSLVATNELVFCSYQKGRWNDVAAIDDAPYEGRSNFSVGVTRKLEETDDRLQTKIVPGLTLHVAWWSESGRGDAAQYAMLTVENGNVVDTNKRPLMDLVDSRLDIANNVAEDNLELFRHPTVFESANHETVDVVFGDVYTNKFHRITIRTGTMRPDAHARVRIPIGVRDRNFGGPAKSLAIKSAANVSAVPAGEDGVAFYFTDGSAMKYVMYRGEEWSGLKSVTLNEKLSVDAAAEAIRRMASAD
jgi:hypothetical protein